MRQGFRKYLKIQNIRHKVRVSVAGLYCKRYGDRAGYNAQGQHHCQINLKDLVLRSANGLEYANLPDLPCKHCRHELRNEHGSEGKSEETYAPLHEQQGIQLPLVGMLHEFWYLNGINGDAQ